MALPDRLATVPAQSPMVNLNFRQAVHVTQLEVTGGEGGTYNDSSMQRLHLLC